MSNMFDFRPRKSAGPGKSIFDMNMDFQKKNMDFQKKQQSRKAEGHVAFKNTMSGIEQSQLRKRKLKQEQQLHARKIVQERWNQGMKAEKEYKEKIAKQKAREKYNKIKPFVDAVNKEPRHKGSKVTTVYGDRKGGDAKTMRKHGKQFFGGSGGKSMFEW